MTSREIRSTEADNKSVRRLAAIMFTDIVDFTALNQRNEARALEVLEVHNNMVRPFFSKFGGREVKTIGDSFLVEFDNALDATLCAVEIQEFIHDYDATVGDDRKIRLRIGIHLGDVVHKGGDIFGDAVNIASRIQPLAYPEGVCVSEQMFAQIHNKIGLELEQLERAELDNVSFPTDVYKVVMPWEKPGDVRPHKLRIEQFSSIPLDHRRIAVLPFASMSPDPNDEYFADGLTEELIDTLCQIRGLEVIARTSVMNYKKKEKNVSQIGRELKAGSLVEGSVRKVGKRIRVTAQLINVSTESHIWSSRYDKDLDDIFAVQSDIAEKVAGELKIRLLEPEKRLIEKKPTENMEAYTCFLQGMQLVTGLTNEQKFRARDLFEQAISLDPDFARAYAGLARCYEELGNQGYVQWNEAIEKGKIAAKKSLEIDPDVAEAHCSLAKFMLMAEEDLEARHAELKKALELNSNLADAYFVLAQESGVAGDLTEMVVACEKAYQLDPLAPDVIRLLGNSYLYAGREEDLLNHSKKTVHLNPYGTYRYMFDYYVSKGNIDMAERTLMELERIGPDLEQTYLNRGYLAAIKGETQKAQTMIDKLDESHRPGWAGSSSAGMIYLALGNLDKFFEYMFRSLDEGTIPITMLRYDPLVDAARKDPRFAEILRRFGIKFSPPHSEFGNLSLDSSIHGIGKMDGGVHR